MVVVVVSGLVRLQVAWLATFSDPETKIAIRATFIALQPTPGGRHPVNPAVLRGRHQMYTLVTQGGVPAALAATAAALGQEPLRASSAQLFYDRLFDFILKMSTPFIHRRACYMTVCH